jgi:methylmalonyl-CoA/ethylmalonyl-CoA epimerase
MASSSSNTTSNTIFQICVVVHDVRQANAHWARILGLPEAPIDVIFSGGILHYTHGQPVDYVDCQVAKYPLDAFVLELMQPGPGPSPWRDFLDRRGPGVFHFCVQVGDRKVFQQTLADIGVGLPYHVGYYPGGSYSYVQAADQLGLELSVNHHANHEQLMQALLSGAALPFDELR